MTKTLATVKKAKRANRVTPQKQQRAKRKAKVDRAAMIHQNICATPPYLELQPAGLE
jgi:hypothetical protein